MSRRRFAASLVAGLALQAIAAFAAVAADEREVTIGLGASVTSTDPHFHTLTTNTMMARHFFDSLIEPDAQLVMHPGLAESWRPLDDTSWEIKLRRGVKFHDGSEFDAKDVVASFKRAPNVPNSPASFAIYLSAAKAIQVIDRYTIHILTDKPAPLLPNDLSNIMIIPARLVDATTADFNAGTAMIGTGPFKFVEYVPGDHVTMVRNDAYWGDPPAWSKVTFRIITNAAARVAALRSGGLQMIDNVPTADIATLKRDPELRLSSTISNRVIYLHMDQWRAVTPFALDKAGRPLAANPFKDLRVRQALSKAINRQAIVDRVMEGQAIPAAQLLPDGFFGVSPDLAVERYDPEGARKLLAEAGYPDGFRLTVHGPNDRYINDDKVLQAVAQMFSRVGIETRVETMPWASYATRSGKLEFSMMLVGWGADTGETSSALRSFLATSDREKGMGTGNRGRYSNPGLDAVLEHALATVDDGAREKLLWQADEIAMRDVGVIPLHYEVSTWATRKGFSYAGMANQNTLAMNLKPAP
jgi:peptide/nickel transport system substrate-binding protein